MDDGRHPSPRRVKELGPEGNCGDAARRACAEWRWTATQLLLDSAAGGGGCFGHKLHDENCHLPVKRVGKKNTSA